MILKILSLLRNKKFDLTNEKVLQEQMKEVFSLNEIEFIKEAHLGSNESIIDFKVGKIGIEVKIKGRPMNIYKQIERYLKTDSIDVLILVTNKSMGVPAFINDKPVYVVNLGKAWL